MIRGRSCKIKVDSEGYIKSKLEINNKMKISGKMGK